jgi:BioD-like phosphotransacetylase family protein
MDKFVIASIGEGAGKTSVIVGLAKVMKRPFGYLKPLGDRMIYREKKVWDYDADVITKIFGMREDPEALTIGFEHSKLRYMYDEEGRKKRLQEMVSQSKKELLFVEGGKGLRYGVSIGLDPISVAKYIDAKLVIVIDGHVDTLVDDAIYVKNYLDMTGVAFKGIIFNKVQNMEDFKNVHLKRLTEMGIQVLGVVPYQKELTFFTVSYLADRLFAKVITGENALHRVIRNILVGAMSINALFETSLFQKEDMLVITSGDRADMILAAIQSDAACVVITNNILPSSNIISKAYERNIPMLLVPQDTYQATTKIDNIEALLTKEDTQKISMVEELTETYIHWKEMIGS